MSTQTIPSLIDDLRSEDPKKRLVSVKNLSTIAQALGPEKTRVELLPFLEEFFTEDDDEVLKEVIDILGRFSEYIGGNSHFEKLLKVLEGFTRFSESYVREKAIDAIKNILRTVDLKANEEVIMGLIARSFNSEFHCSKDCLASVLPNVFTSLSSANQAASLNLYLGLANNDIHIVRKFAAKNLASLIKVCSAPHEKDVIEIFNILLKDSQDLNRIYLVDAFVSLPHFNSFQNNSQLMINYFKNLTENSSWRIKYSLCDKCLELGQVMGKSNVKLHLLPFFMKCIQDSEAELRTISALKIEVFCKILDPEDVVGKIAPLFKTLLFDSHAFVRAALASSMLTVSPLIGKKSTMEIIIPVFTNLLKDQESEVRVNLFKKLGDLTKVMGVESILNSIIPAFQELMNEKNWRTRKSALEYLPVLAKQIGTPFFNEKINKIIFNSFTDKVSSVREGAGISLKNVTEILGSSWLEQNILPSLMSLANNTNYLYRQTLIYAISNLMTCLNGASISGVVVPFLLEISKDSIPNVKIASAKALKICYKATNSQNDKEKIKKQLNILATDSDFDVKYVAKQNIENL